MLYGFAESLICASNGGGGACGGKAVRLSVRVYANSNDESEEGKQSGSETINYPARLELRNDHDQIVYQADGTAQCGS